MAETKIRVLVAEDSAPMRRKLARVLGSEASIEVVGLAVDGAELLDKLSLKPDVVVLDMSMPNKDGMTALTELRQTNSHLPVIMFSALTARGAAATVQALSGGANDYVLKPGAQDDSDEVIGVELVNKIKIQAGRARRRARAAAQVTVTTRKRKAEQPPPHVVVIASSTGGPSALGEVLQALPESLAVPILLVQHMPNRLFTQALAQSLSEQCALEVLEAEHGHVPVAGQVCVAPGGSHLALVRSEDAVRCELLGSPPVNGCRPAADPLFRSAAQAYGGRVLGVVLTGMGHDGLDGASAIVEAGGEVVVQDAPTSVVWGMPGAVAEAGLASLVLPLSDIAREIAARVEGRA